MDPSNNDPMEPTPGWLRRVVRRLLGAFAQGTAAGAGTTVGTMTVAVVVFTVRHHLS